MKHAYFSIGESKSVVLGTYGELPAPNCTSQTLAPPQQGPRCSIEPRKHAGLESIVQSKNFVKFVESIVDFKLGRTPNSYSQPQAPVRAPPSAFFCSLVMNRKGQWWNIPQTKPVSCHRIDPEPSIHDGIQCNGCGLLPIRGIRYVCRSCEDYDLCEACYIPQRHEHNNFESIVQSNTSMKKDRLRKWAAMQKSPVDRTRWLRDTTNSEHCFPATKL